MVPSDSNESWCARQGCKQILIGDPVSIGFLNAASQKRETCHRHAYPFSRLHTGVHSVDFSRQIENARRGEGGSGDLGNRISTVHPAFGVL